VRCANQRTNIDKLVTTDKLAARCFQDGSS
jgi:hypothetical protein